MKYDNVAGVTWLTTVQFTMGPDRHLHRTCLAYVNQMFQQISGININYEFQSIEL